MTIKQQREQEGKPGKLGNYYRTHKRKNLTLVKDNMPKLVNGLQQNKSKVWSKYNLLSYISMFYEVEVAPDVLMDLLRCEVMVGEGTGYRLKY